MTMRLLSLKDIKALGIPHTRQGLYKLWRAGNFPKPVKVGLKRNAWVESEVLDWLSSLVEKRDEVAK